MINNSELSRPLTGGNLYEPAELNNLRDISEQRLTHRATAESKNLIPLYCEGVKNSPVKLPSNKVIHHELTSTPFYYSEDVSKLNQRPQAASSKKEYTGFHRVTQELRHISTLVYSGGKKILGINLKEVQVAIVSGEIHISSNFHAERISEILLKSFNEDKELLLSPKNKKLTHVNKRTSRHIQKTFRLLDENYFQTIISKGREEIKKNDIPDKCRISIDDLCLQFEKYMNTVFCALSMLSSKDISCFVIHIPTPSLPQDVAVKQGVTATRHAERNIIDYIATNKDEILMKSIDLLSTNSSQIIIIPIEGRFIPCGFCYEQELLDKSPGGIFDPNKEGLILFRSTKRAGKFYANEIQYISHAGFSSDETQSKALAMKLLSDIKISSEHLSVLKMPLNTDTSFNSDSE